MVNRFFILLLLLSYTLLGFNSDSIFYNSNNLYSTDNFQKAIDGYLSIVDGDVDNRILYYNIGNCYYKLGQLGYARLYYEKAKLYNPTDKDVLHNIEIVKAKLIDDVKEVPEFFISRIIKKIRLLLSPSQWAYATLIVLYINLCLFLLFLFSSFSEAKINSLRSLFFMFPIFLILVCFLFYSNSQNQHDNAILISSNTYVKTAPSISSDDYFVIHEGLSFKIIDQVDNWSRVLLSDGKDGWIENRYFLKIEK